MPVNKRKGKWDLFYLLFFVSVGLFVSYFTSFEEGFRSIFHDKLDKLFIISLFLLLGLVVYSLRKNFYLKSEFKERSETENTLKSITTSAKDAILLMDNNGTISFWNSAATDIFGYTKDEVFGKNLHEILAPVKYHGAYNNAFPKFKLSGEGPVVGKTLELSALRKSGEEFPMELSVSSVKLKDKWHAVGILRDVSERKKRESKIFAVQEELKKYQQNLEGIIENKTRDLVKREKIQLSLLEDLQIAKDSLVAERNELDRSNKELEQFAYIASHDLQEPLRMIASYVQLLEKRYKGKLGEDADDFINFSVDGAKRMQELINDLLEYSRVGTRGKPFRQYNSKESLDEAIRNLRLSIKESGADIITGPLPLIVADKTQLTQVFQNLISNAIKFRSNVPLKIYISAEMGKEVWTFSVVDNGIGFEQQFSDKIFNLFQRLHTRKEFEGTGLGLAICKKIIERHGGKIWAESKIGKGSTFYFTIHTGKG